MSRVVRLVLAGLLAVFLVGAPAQAAPRPPDPELGAPPAARTSGPSAAKVLPGSVDSDVYALAISPKSFSFVVAGHLELTLKPGSTTSYVGSFVDYVGNRSTKASADASDPAAPTLKLAAKNGKFIFRLDQYFGSASYSGTVVSKPSKLKVPTSRITFYAASHLTQTASYGVVLTERSGAINNPLEYTGTLTMAYDANGRISGGQVTVTNGKGKTVTHALKSSGFYSAGVFYTVVQVDKRYFGLTGTGVGTGFTGYGFGADGSRTTEWFVTGTA